MHGQQNFKNNETTFEYPCVM